MTIAVAMMASPSLFAQADAPEKMTQEQRTAKHIEMLDEKLSLTSEQKTKLTTLFTDFEQKRDQQKQQSKEDMEAFEASVLAVLTTEQQATYKQMQSERKDPPSRDKGDKKGGPQGQGGPAPKDMSAQRLKQLDEKLSLTDDQKTKIQALYDAFDKQMEAERTSGSKPDPEAMKTNMDKLDSDIAALLTSDQQTAYKQFLQDEAAARQNGRPGKPDKQKKSKK